MGFFQVPFGPDVKPEPDQQQGGAPVHQTRLHDPGTTGHTLKERVKVGIHNVGRYRRNQRVGSLQVNDPFRHRKFKANPHLLGFPNHIP